MKSQSESSVACDIVICMSCRHLNVLRMSIALSLYMVFQYLSKVRGIYSLIVELLKVGGAAESFHIPTKKLVLMIFY